MMTQRWVATVLTATVLLLATVTQIVHADVLLDATKIATTAGSPLPSEYSFTTTVAEALTVTLTDIQEPAAFTSLQVGVSLGDTLIGQAAVDATHAATVSLPAAIGTYVVHVIGSPDATQGFGAYGVCVTRDADPTPRTCVSADSYSGNIQVPSTPTSAATSTVSTSFMSTTAGTYTVALSDDVFPVALASLSALIINDSTQTVVSAGAPTQITLAAGTSYQLLIAAQADATILAGLYGIQITDPSGTVLFSRTLPVGELGAATTLQNPGEQSLSIGLVDYAYPAQLSGLGVAVTVGASALAVLPAAGTASIADAPAGPLSIWTYAVAASQPGVYGVTVSAGPNSLLSNTAVVNPAAMTGGPASYAYVVSLPAAGTYNLSPSDFQFPSALQSLSATVAQNGTLLTESSSGDFTVTQAGPVVVLVQAQAPASGDGIFSVTLQSSGTTPQVLLDQTQSIGGVFDQRTVNFGASGGFDLTLADLGFPASFQNLAAVLSQGNQVIGKVYGAGTFSFNATPGQYVVSIVATPGSQNYGLYAIHIASSVPTVTFTAAESSVTSGQTDTLTWSSVNATACSASGGTGWVGTQATSGTLALQVTASETLTLTCTGAGGSTTQSIAIAASAAPTKSGGGGGAMDLLGLIGLLGLLSARRCGIGRDASAGD